jgi:hypothetical protein
MNVCLFVSELQVSSHSKMIITAEGHVAKPVHGL